MNISLQNISKQYDKRWIFKGINAEFQLNDKVVFLGDNGSGKSTLLQICSGYLSPHTGTISFFLNDTILKKEDIFEHVAISAPYVELIEEMTLMEFLKFHFSFKKSLLSIAEIVAYIGLEGNENILLENFSSGMKQRVSLAQAFFSDTEILLLDEPCSNLDEKGIELYNNLMEKCTVNRIVLVASNDAKEYNRCNKEVHLLDYK
jgi:ABC-type multidrug transport system ATPase subunit